MLDLTKWDGDVDVLLRAIRCSSDVFALDSLANQASRTGATRTAISYLTAFRIHEIYLRVEQAPDRVLQRHLKLRGYEPPPTGATGLRRHYNRTIHGWETISAWRNDWASGVPVSPSSAWEKMRDIQGWRNAGASWETILKLLEHTPMAGRDFLEKSIRPEALPPGGELQFLEELPELPPGQARKLVSEAAGEVQIWTADAQWHQGSLLLKIILEASDGTETYDLIVRQVSGHESWGAVALWLSGKLGKRILIGG